MSIEEKENISDRFLRFEIELELLCARSGVYMRADTDSCDRPAIVLELLPPDRELNQHHNFMPPVTRWEYLPEFYLKPPPRRQR